jgi:hypothetical protein
MRKNQRKSKGRGWHGDSRRHALARKGIRTAKKRIKTEPMNIYAIYNGTYFHDKPIPITTALVRKIDSERRGKTFDGVKITDVRYNPREHSALKLWMEFPGKEKEVSKNGYIEIYSKGKIRYSFGWYNDEDIEKAHEIIGELVLDKKPGTKSDKNLKVREILKMEDDHVESPAGARSLTEYEKRKRRKLIKDKDKEFRGQVT